MFCLGAYENIRSFFFKATLGCRNLSSVGSWRDNRRRCPPWHRQLHRRPRRLGLSSGFWFRPAWLAGRPPAGQSLSDRSPSGRTIPGWPAPGRAPASRPPRCHHTVRNQLTGFVLLLLQGSDLDPTPPPAAHGHPRISVFLRLASSEAIDSDFRVAVVVRRGLQLATGG